MKQWFIGYKIHLATDDFSAPIGYVVTGACVHDCKVAVPLMKMAYQCTDFLYALMDKGYLNPDINTYADMIGRKVIIDQRARRGIAPISPKLSDTRREPPKSERTVNSRTDIFPTRSTEEAVMHGMTSSLQSC